MLFASASVFRVKKKKDTRLLCCSAVVSHNCWTVCNIIPTPRCFNMTHAPFCLFAK